jgi:hypothetical protein
VHWTHDGPQCAVVLHASQVEVFFQKPPLHVKPHAVPSQVALPFAGTVHSRHESPQCAGSSIA